MTTSDTPATLGYRMPAEWEPHEATWLTWPHYEPHWPGKIEKVYPVWARMVKELETGEDVHILIKDAAVRSIAENAMKHAGVLGTRVHLHDVPNNAAWARDSGPIFVKNPEGKLLMTHWGYNAWGDQWPHELDEHIPEAAQNITGIDRVKVPMVLEGGSIDVNGEGTLLTTEVCLLNPDRNPGMTKDRMEEILKDYLGVTNVLWLKGVHIEGDDTSGHVDALARFVTPKTVLTVVEENPDDPAYEQLQSNLRQLHSMKDQDGHLLEVITIPLPKNPVVWKGKRLPATYANFYIGNDAVLLPVFNDPNDRIAIDVLTKAFPGRRIAGIDATDLIWGFGAIHCVTQQQPLSGKKTTQS